MTAEEIIEKITTRPDTQDGVGLQASVAVALILDGFPLQEVEKVLVFMTDRYEEHYRQTDWTAEQNSTYIGVFRTALDLLRKSAQPLVG